MKTNDYTAIADLEFAISSSYDGDLQIDVKILDLFPSKAMSFEALSGLRTEINSFTFEEGFISNLDLKSLNDEFNYVGKAKVTVEYETVDDYFNGPETNVQVMLEFISHQKSEHILEDSPGDCFMPIQNLREKKDLILFKDVDEDRTFSIENHNSEKSILSINGNSVFIRHHDMLRVFRSVWGKLCRQTIEDTLKLGGPDLKNRLSENI